MASSERPRKAAGEFVGLGSLKRRFLVFFGVFVFWCFLVFFGVFWCFLVFFGVFWCFCFLDVFWCFLVFFGVFWCFLVFLFFGVFWCFLVFLFFGVFVFWMFFGVFVFWMFFGVFGCFLVFLVVIKQSCGLCVNAGPRSEACLGSIHTLSWPFGKAAFWKPRQVENKGDAEPFEEETTQKNLKRKTN